jgi:hypothetical protein
MSLVFPLMHLSCNFPTLRFQFFCRYLLSIHRVPVCGEFETGIIIKLSTSKKQNSIKGGAREISLEL